MALMRKECASKSETIKYYTTDHVSLSSQSNHERGEERPKGS